MVTYHMAEAFLSLRILFLLWATPDSNPVPLCYQQATTSTYLPVLLDLFLSGLCGSCVRVVEFHAKFNFLIWRIFLGSLQVIHGPLFPPPVSLAVRQNLVDIAQISLFRRSPQCLNIQHTFPHQDSGKANLNVNTILSKCWRFPPLIVSSFFHRCPSHSWCPREGIVTLYCSFYSIGFFLSSMLSFFFLFSFLLYCAPSFFRQLN